MKNIYIFILLICVIFSGCGKANNENTDKHSNDKALAHPNNPFENVQDVQSEAEVTTTEIITTTAPNITTTVPNVTTAPPVTTTAPQDTEPVNNEKLLFKDESKFFNINDEVVFMSYNNADRGFKLKVTDIKLVNYNAIEFMQGYSTKIKMTVIFTPYRYCYTNISDIFAITDIPSIQRYHAYHIINLAINTPNQYDIYFYSNSDEEFTATFRDKRYLNFYIKYKINPKELKS